MGIRSRMSNSLSRLSWTGLHQQRSTVTCGLLLLINLLNYIDRYTMSPLLEDISSYFGVSYVAVGILPTVFICVYMVFAPIFGYLGDRYSRKLLICIGIVIWSGSVIACTLLPGNAFWAFVLLRGVVGIGEASYATIAPTIIADFFVGYARSKVLALFYFGIPVGAGLGTVIGPLVADAFGSWQWGLRVSPVLGLLCAVLFLFTFDPPRGLSEDSVEVASTSKWAWFTDIVTILRIKTYLWTTLGFAGVTFSVGALTWWSPTYVVYSQRMNDVEYTSSEAGVAFGLITALGGLVGTLLGSAISQMWRKRDRKSDCLVCGYSLLLATPLCFLGLTIPNMALIPGYIIVFIAVVLLCFNWAVNPDILLYVVPPAQRATAAGFQTMVSHVLGDAISPYILGQIAESIRGEDNSDAGFYLSFRSAFYTACFASLVGSVCYFVSSFYVVEDWKRCSANAKFINGVDKFQKQDTIKVADISMESIDASNPVVVSF